MYSNESKNGFSILDLLVKIIFAALLIFIIIWLFQKKVPNMKPFYSNVFRENIKYMQDAGEAYFTTDKLPQNEGESVRLTLDEMEKLNLVLPFVDKDGKTCSKNSSYVSVTKLPEDKGYELKTYLVCGSESSSVIKVLGCHSYCPNSGNGDGSPCICNCNCGGNCDTEKKNCTISKVTEYQFRKYVSGSSTKYSCPSGYTLKGTNCIKTILKDSKSAIVKKTETKTYVKAATLVQGDAQLSPLTVVKGTKTETKDATAKTSTDTKTATANTDTKTATASTSTVNATAKASTDTKAATANTDTKTATASTSTVNATAKNSTSTVAATKNTSSYACTKTRTVQKCTTTYKQEPYSCNCSTKLVGGVLKTTCNTCYKSVPVQSCQNVNENYTDTCYRDTYTCPSGYTLSGTTCSKTTTSYTCPSGYTRSGTKCNKTTYSCPSGYTLSGTSCKKTTYSCPSGYTLSGTNCSKKVTTYSCPSGYTLSGTSCKKTTYSCASGYTLSGTSCKKTTYSCASGYTLSGTTCSKTTTSYTCPSGYTRSGTKCSRNVTTYSCPSGTDVKEGSGSSLKCYKLIQGSVSYVCKDSGYKLNGTSCVKTVTETKTTKECNLKGYKLEGDKCNLYSTDTKAATAKKINTSGYKYTWSKNTTLAGYERTGKTRTVNGKEICK